MAQFCDVSSVAMPAGVDLRRDQNLAGEHMQPTPGYPIVLSTGRPVSVSRFWAIPIVGILVKAIILIPHLIVLYVLGIVLGLAHLVIWAMVLFTGQYPEWGFNLTAGVLRWWVRLLIYLY